MGPEVVLEVAENSSISMTDAMQIKSTEYHTSSKLKNIAIECTLVSKTLLGIQMQVSISSFK